MLVWISGPSLGSQRRIKMWVQQKKRSETIRRAEEGEREGENRGGGRFRVTTLMRLSLL